MRQERRENSGVWLKERGIGFRTLNNDVKSEGRKVILIEKRQYLHVKQLFFFFRLGMIQVCRLNNPNLSIFPASIKYTCHSLIVGGVYFPAAYTLGLAT